MTLEEKRKEAIKQIQEAIGDAIKESGSIPSGHLYAMLMGRIGLTAYQRMIRNLKREKKVSESGHLLTWEG